MIAVQDRPNPSTPAMLQALPSWLLSQANVRAHRLISDAFADHAATGHQVRVLAALQEQGPSSQISIGRAAHLDRSDVARVLDSLAADQFIRRRPDPSDGRRKIVSITTKGSRRLRALRHVLDAVQQELLAPLTNQERTDLRIILAKLQ